MNQSLSRIQALLKTLVLLSPEIRKKLLARVESFSEQKKEILLSFLLEAEKNQQTLLWKASQKNPEFFNELKRKGIQLKHDDTRAKESKESAGNQEQLLNLEAELETLFDKK